MKIASLNSANFKFDDFARFLNLAPKRRGFGCIQFTASQSKTVKFTARNLDEKRRNI